MIKNTDDFIIFFQQVKSVIPGPNGQFSLLTILYNPKEESFLKNIITDFPEKDVSLVNETNHSGAFINPFNYPKGKNTLFLNQIGRAHV